MSIALDQLPPRRPAVITSINWSGAEESVIRRLYEMGLDEGVDVELLHRGPMGGDPIAVRVGNMVLAMRRAQAGLVHVVLAEDYHGLPVSPDSAG